MNEEVESEVFEMDVTQTTTCEHEWARDADDPNSDMESYRCTKCPAGMSKARHHE